MNTIVHFTLSDILPKRKAVFEHQGFSKGASIKDHIHALLTDAMDLFTTYAQPQGIISELSVNEFATIFKGEGENAPDTPLSQIFPLAENLALFAATMGNHVSEKITELFAENDFALGYMLDSVASLAADEAAGVCEKYFFNDLSQRQLTSSGSAVLGYSPGYCGWHVSGQKKIFQFLRPEKIGISLNDSYLMRPLKSVSGVLVAGKREIHVFKPNYPFCRFCKTHSCRTRIRSLLIGV